MDIEECCLKTTNYEKKQVIFLEKTRQIKAGKHFELRGEDGERFINGRVREAIQNPHFVYEDFAEPKKRRAYYFLEYGGDKNRYTKVVITNHGNLLVVITAYRPNHVKERGKTKLIYGEDR